MTVVGPDVDGRAGTGSSEPATHVRFWKEGAKAKSWRFLSDTYRIECGYSNFPEGGTLCLEDSEVGQAFVY